MKRLILPLFAMMLAPAAARAERVAALSGDRILTFQAANPMASVSSSRIVGLGSDTLVGIDFRASNRTVYGLGASGAVYTLTAGGGRWTATSTGSITAALNGTGFEIDFNPVPDRLRISSNANQSLRLNPDTPPAAWAAPTSTAASTTPAAARPRSSV